VRIFFFFHVRSRGVEGVDPELCDTSLYVLQCAAVCCSALQRIAVC